MGAISFDQPSKGVVASTSKALTVINTDTGGALSCIADNAAGNGIVGQSKGSGVGLYGISVEGTGVYAVSQSGNGVRGESKGDGVGVYGVSVDGTGVYGTSTNRTAMSGLALSKTGYGLRGENKVDGTGIFGVSASGTGILGLSESGNGIGLRGESKGDGKGVYANSTNGTGIYATGGKLAGYFKGDVEVTGDIRLINADCAEEFDINSDIEPGTVMVLNDRGTLEPSCFPYDKKVAGIISGAGGFKPGIVLDKQEHKTDTTRIAVALIGKVYCKVDATLSSIEIGDLLTTSSTIGHAMKACDPLNAFGAVIGKALQAMKSGKGMIPVLVSLQ